MRTSRGFKQSATALTTVVAVSMPFLVKAIMAGEQEEEENNKEYQENEISIMELDMERLHKKTLLNQTQQEGGGRYPYLLCNNNKNNQCTSYIDTTTNTTFSQNLDRELDLRKLSSSASLLFEKKLPTLMMQNKHTAMNVFGVAGLPSTSLSTCQCEESLPYPPPATKTRTTNSVQRSSTVRRLDFFSTKDTTLESRYDIDWDAPPLGTGAFGSVHLAINKTTKEPVALKKIKKKFTDQESFQREMRALLYIRSSGGHPNICALREHFDDHDNYSLLFDLIGGGELFDHLINNGAYSEADAARLVREVASALAFLHGIGIVHADMKPENLMLSTARRADAVIKLVDFGCSELLVEDDLDKVIIDDNNKDDSATASTATTRKISSVPKDRITSTVLTPAYCPPEVLALRRKKYSVPQPPMDMWSLGVILYILLTGVHPFDLNAISTDKEIEERITNPKVYTPPIRNSPITQHLSESAIDLIEKLMTRDPEKRLSAYEMLEHPWIRGETASKTVIAGSDERLHKFRKFKSKLQAKFFQDAVAWSDDDFAADEARRKTSLIERSFRSFDTKEQGYLTPEDLGKNFDQEDGDTNDSGINTDEDGGDAISMSDFHNLLSESMKSRYFPKGHVVYHEGDIGDHMYFINSGTIEVTTHDGSKAKRNQGDFFGEGAMLHPQKIRSATIRCKTPVHTIEISREYFEKYLASSETGLLLTLREKDKIRKRNRAKTILRLQNNLRERHYKKGDYLFKVGEKGDSMFILEKGRADVLVKGRNVFAATHGNVCGEHSLLTGRLRNTSALCVTDTCVAYEMMGRDFRKLMDESPNMKDSLSDLNNRRDFKKAVVFRLKKEFPYQNPREAFDAVDEQKCGLLDAEVVGNLMREMDEGYTDDEVRALIETIDLTGSGTVCFDEFKKVFVADIRTSASM